MEKKEVKKEELTKEELQTIINLLYNGKFGFSAQEDNQVITPLVNKISRIIDLRYGKRKV